MAGQAKKQINNKKTSDGIVAKKISKSKKHKIRDVKKLRKHGNKVYKIHVYMIEMALGFVIMYLQKPSGIEAGFSRSFENHIDIENEQDTTYRDNLRVNDELYRRGPDNEKLPSKPGSSYHWKMWVTKLPDSSLGAMSMEHVSQRKEWIAHIIDELNSLGANPNEYKIYTKFEFAADLTVGHGLPLNKYMLTDDVIEIFKTAFLPDDADSDTAFEVLEEYYEELFASHRGETVVECMKKCLAACGINVFDRIHDDIIEQLHLHNLRDE